MVRFPEETRIPSFLQSAQTDPWASPYSSLVSNCEFILRSTADPKWTNHCVGLTTLQPSCADYLENLGASTSWNRQGLSRPVMGLLYLSNIM